MALSVPLPSDDLRIATARAIPKIFVCWLAVTMLAFTRRSIVLSISGGDGFLTAALLHVLYALVWTGFTFALFSLADRIPSERIGWRTLPILIAVVVAVTFGRIVAESWLTAVFGRASEPSAVLLRILMTAGDRTLIDSAVVLGVGYALRAARREQLLAIRSVELQRQLAVAELGQLKAQLQPHFLFNTLHSISALVTSDSSAARRMIARLSDLLRVSLWTSRERTIALEQELAIVEHYLEIQRIRFGDRLTPLYEIAPEVFSAAVPPFLLQPLVENAVKHALADTDAECVIALRARRDGDLLRIELENDGAVVPAEVAEGVGLGNTRARLRTMYGDEARFDIEWRTQGGAVARLAIPYRDAPEP